MGFVAIVAVVVGLILSNDRTHEGMGYLSLTFGFALTLSSIWCVTRSLDVRRELTQFLDALIDSSREAAIIRELRTRATHLRRNALFSLVLIVVALAAGLWSFVYAGTISNLDRMRSEYMFQRQLDLYQHEHELRSKEQSKQPSSSTQLDVEKRLERMEDEQAQLKATIASQASSVGDQSRTQQMVTTTTTRVGSVIILLFLVQVLVTLYRYNIRAAAFYDGRADALIMARREDTELGTLVEIFTPTTLDFGKMPSTPLHAVLETAKEALRKTPS